MLKANFSACLFTDSKGQNLWIDVVSNLALQPQPWAAIFCKSPQCNPKGVTEQNMEMKRMVECLPVKAQHGFQSVTVGHSSILPVCTEASYCCRQISNEQNLGHSKVGRHVRCACSRAAMAQRIDIVRAQAKYSEVGRRHTENCKWASESGEGVHKITLHWDYHCIYGHKWCLQDLACKIVGQSSKCSSGRRIEANVPPNANMHTYRSRSEIFFEYNWCVSLELCSHSHLGSWWDTNQYPGSAVLQITH